jgi:hypothetical protein
MLRTRRGLTVALAAGVVIAAAPASGAAPQPFLKGLRTIHTLATTVPSSGSAKGDQNPYGVAVVPVSAGRLVKGDVLVSNFNNAKNQQGTGSSIAEVSPSGKVSAFAIVPRPSSTPAVGLTTALVALRSGFVIVGNLPAPGGNSSRARSGALTVLNSAGHVAETITAADINGPWDMTASDNGSTATLFVTNVLNGTVAAKGHVVRQGTVVRLELSIPAVGVPQVKSNQVVATGFAEHTDPSALIIGPTGVGLGVGGTLYVADSSGDRIAAIPQALTRTTALGGGGMTVSSGKALNDPLGLAIAPNGNVITANGGDGKLVETTPGGRQVAVKTVVPNGAGDLFGLAVAPGGRGLYFVDDAGSGGAANSLRILH